MMKFNSKEFGVLRFLEWLFVLAFIAIVLISLIGCKTTKQTTQTYKEVQTSIDSDIETITNSTVDVAINEVVERKIEQTDSMVINEIEVVYSKPDSTGMQYPQKITSRETRIVSKDKEETNRARDSTAKEDFSQSRSEKTDLKSKSSITIDQETEKKTKAPALFNYMAITLALGALVLAYFILKRFKLIK